MTANQIKYAEYKENQRHNLASEAISTREVVTHEMNAETNRLNYEESARHNVASETLTSQANQEIQRHNIAGEAISTKSLEESKRHNVASEELTSRNIDEVVRHNQETERMTQQSIDESIRHNKASESIGRTQAAAAMQSAQASMISAGAAVTNAEANKQNAETNAKNAETNYQKMVNERFISQGELNQTTRRNTIQEQSLEVNKRGQNLQFWGGLVGDVINAGSKTLGSGLNFIGTAMSIAGGG